MQIRESSDRPEIAAAIEVVQQGRSGMVLGRRRNIHLRSEVSFVGEAGGAVVALASIRGSVRHPQMVEIGIDAIDAEIEELGPLVDLLVNAAGNRIIEVKTADYDPVSHWVRSDRRFAHEITVESGTMVTSPRPDPVGYLPVGYAAEAVGEVTPEIEELFERIYAEAHAWTGQVVEFPESGSWISVVGEPVAIGIVWNRTGEPIAAAGVSVPEDVAQGAYLLPGGVLASERAQRPALLSHAVEAAVAEAARMGVPRVAYEDSRPDYGLQGEILDRFDRTATDVTEMWISRDR